MTDALRDGMLGGVGAVFATTYIVAARGIEDSLLADAVGAGGVPQAAGIVLLAASLGLVLEAAVRGARRSGPSQRTDSGAGRALALAAALVLVLLAYALLLPLLGYIVAVSALVLAVALLAGARDRVALALCTALSGVGLWAVFELALRIRMPAGSIWG